MHLEVSCLSCPDSMTPRRSRRIAGLPPQELDENDDMEKFTPCYVAGTVVTIACTMLAVVFAIWN